MSDLEGAIMGDASPWERTMSEPETISAIPMIPTAPQTELRSGLPSRKVPWDPAASRRKPPIAYTDFDLTELIQQFNLRLSQSSLMTSVPPREATTWLKETLERGKTVAFIS